MKHRSIWLCSANCAYPANWAHFCRSRFCWAVCSATTSIVTKSGVLLAWGRWSGPLVRIPKSNFLVLSVAFGIVLSAEINQSSTSDCVASSLTSFLSWIGLVKAHVAPISLNVLFSQGRIVAWKEGRDYWANLDIVGRVARRNLSLC